MTAVRPPLKVLHVISALNETHGGAPLALRNLALAQQHRGARVTVAMSWARGGNLSVTAELRAHGIDVMTIGPSFSRFMWHPSTRRLVTRAVADADVVHVHGLWEDILHQAAAASRRLGRPYVMKPCGMLDWWNLSRNYRVKRAFLAVRLIKDLNNADAIHYTCEPERENAAHLQLTAPTLVESNGIDSGLFRELPARGRFRATLPFGGGIIMFLGRVGANKGLDLLVQALAHPACAGINLAVVGPDEQPFRGHLDRRIGELGLANRVFFAGMLRGQAVVEALVDADLTVLPSRRDSFGTSVLESLAAGTPVIVSDQVGIHPDISREATGAVVPLDVERIAAALAEWMRDPARRRTAGARGRAYALGYDWDRIAARWMAHYERLLSRPCAPPLLTQAAAAPAPDR